MSSKRLFGTDGIRGPFGAPPLDAATVRRLGVALGADLAERHERPQALLGGDTRASTPQICDWLAAGLSAGGCAVRFGGVLPTPAIARLVPETGSQVGIAVSASHNPTPDNGIKLLDEHGFKWDSRSEDELEQRLKETRHEPDSTPHLEADPSLARFYLDLLEATADDGPLTGLSVVLDSANGAAAAFAPALFTRLGAQVHSLADAPDGSNINRECGSTRPQTMAAAVVETGSDLGFAFDGDADRAIAADDGGRIRDGDSLLYLLARWLRRRGELEPPRIVATTMSNLGLELALREADLELVRCDVGDREVVETLKREGLILGGEQSGHIVHLGLAPTGDGLQTALLVAMAILDGKRSLSAELTGFRTYPQVLQNVRVRSKPALESLPTVAAAVGSVLRELGPKGRLVLRYSGTEPLARIMIEGPDQARIEALAESLADPIRREIGAVEEP